MIHRNHEGQPDLAGKAGRCVTLVLQARPVFGFKPAKPQGNGRTGETWPRHPLRQCGNNRILPYCIAPRPVWLKSGVKYRAWALPPAVPSMTIHSHASNVRRLRLMLLLSPGSTWSNSGWLLTVPPWVCCSSASNRLRLCFCSCDRRGSAIAVLLLFSYNRALNPLQLSRDSQHLASTTSTSASRSRRMGMSLSLRTSSRSEGDTWGEPLRDVAQL